MITLITYKKEDEMQSTIIRSLDATQVTSEDLPLQCPPKNIALWDMHPRVYLALDKHNQAQCPYCSATYQLTKKK